MDEHKCEKQEVIDMIKADLSEIKQDVKSLLKYKWQLMGGAGVVGTIIAFIISTFFQ